MIARQVSIRRLAPFAICAFGLGTAAQSADWITAPSFFTHDQAGQRVQQYAPIGPFYTYSRGDYQRSGYRHTRSSIQAGGSVDHYHLVEEFGKPVRPYEEWRFPYRPYSSPYDAWGAPFAGGNFGWGGGPWGGFGGGFGQGFGNRGQGVLPTPNLYRSYQPWFDDRYQPFDDRAPFRNPAFPQQALPALP